VSKKVFSAEELEGISDDEILCATRLWTKKEAIFKTLDERVFSPQSIAISEHSVSTQDIEINGEKYVISVAGDGVEKTKIIEK
jgi:phosphopantetheinyl transferase